MTTATHLSLKKAPSSYKLKALEYLMKKLDKLTAENKRLKAMGKKGTKYSSSSEDGDSSFKEEVSNKGRKRRNKYDKPSYNSMSFNYNRMPNSTSYTSVPVGKAPRFDGPIEALHEK
jgi:hypothetical protein